MKKKYITACFLIVFMITLTGCPVSSPFPLSLPGTEKINEKLIGTWSQSDETLEMKSVEIKKLDDFTMQAVVLEKTENYVEEVTVFKGWQTELDGKTFMYFRDFSSDTAGYYLYCYEIHDDELTTWDVSLLVGGVDAITSTEVYRKEVSASLKLPDCLTGKITWTRK